MEHDICMGILRVSVIFFDSVKGEISFQKNPGKYSLIENS